MMRPAVFLDRDGVIIENRSEYVRSCEDVTFLPNSFEAIRELSQTSYAIVIITNQSAVGRRVITLEQAEQINAYVVDEIRARGGRIDATYLCPHSPEERCDCRKPSPGMLMRAKAELKLDLCSSFLIGDAKSDMDAARTVGVRGILVRTGRGEEQIRYFKAQDLTGCHIAADLWDAVAHILELQRRWHENPSHRWGRLHWQRGDTALG